MRAIAIPLPAGGGNSVPEIFWAILAGTTGVMLADISINYHHLMVSLISNDGAIELIKYFGNIIGGIVSAAVVMYVKTKIEQKAVHKKRRKKP